MQLFDFDSSVVARSNDILKKLVLEAKREYEKDAEHRVHIFMADTCVTTPLPASSARPSRSLHRSQDVWMLAVERCAPEAAHEFHCARAWRQGHDPGRLQGLPCL